MMNMRNAILLLLGCVACGGAEPGPSKVDAAAPKPAPTAPRDVGDSVPLSEDAGARAPVAPVVMTDAVCNIGDVSACACSGGMPGTRTCLAADGQQSACGCTSLRGPDVLVPPVPPKRYTCGGVMCGLYPEEETSVSARGCCTKDNLCGSSSDFVFGAACVERGVDPGTASAKCPDESPNFLDLYGCCRPDGACGLSVDHVANFDVGCIERSQISALLNTGSGQRDFLSLIFFLPNPKNDFKPIRCK